MKRFLSVTCVLLTLSCCDPLQAQLLPVDVTQLFQDKRPVPIREAGLGRGVNFGNMLEAPNEGDWGLFVEEIFFDKVLEAGMDHVRIPISWTHHTSQVAPYEINAEFFDRIDQVVDLALQRGLRVIVNNHHYDAINANPMAEQKRALAIWNQIATRYQSLPEEVYFEILNEPHGAFNDDPELWNQFMIDAVNVIRQTNPNRKIIVGPVSYNSIARLGSFNPPKDEDLIVTVHYYDPFEFTHQGAPWINPTPPTGTPWQGDAFGLTSPWQNWSWNTTVESSTLGLQISYDAGFAGFQVHNPGSVESGLSLHFTIDQPLDFTISVSNNSTGQSAFYQLATTAGQQKYSIDISNFGQANAITNIFLQNNSPNAQATFNLSQFELVTSEAIIPLIGTEADRITESFRSAYWWGLHNGLAMHLGEFGAYNEADDESRVRWTAAVRQNAEQFHIDWSYWEFAAGFGFYDPINDSFRLPLLQALVPERP